MFMYVLGPTVIIKAYWISNKHVSLLWSYNQMFLHIICYNLMCTHQQVITYTHQQNIMFLLQAPYHLNTINYHTHIEIHSIQYFKHALTVYSSSLYEGMGNSLLNWIILALFSIATQMIQYQLILTVKLIITIGVQYSRKLSRV